MIPNVREKGGVGGDPEYNHGFEMSKLPKRFLKSKNCFNKMTIMNIIRGWVMLATVN